MQIVKYKFCPNCGKKTLNHAKLNSTCKECKFILYKDSVACASILPIKNGKVLLGIRRDNPLKGTYDLIGGFLNPGEKAEEAAIREAKEETGLTVKIKDFFGTYPDKYGIDGAFVLVVIFVVEVLKGNMIPNDDVKVLNGSLFPIFQNWI